MKQRKALFIAILLAVCIVVFILSGTGMKKAANKAEQRIRADASSGPIVTDWLPEETFTVVREAKRVNEFNMGHIVIERGDGLWIPVFVIPMREISIGTKVKIAEVKYSRSGIREPNFLIVK